MFRKSKSTVTKKKSKSGLKPFQKLSLYFFNRPRKTAIIWLIVAIFGAASYITLLKRDGFPAIETPFAVANGTYLVNDPAKVDREIATPISDYVLEQEGVKAVQTQAQANFYSIFINYEEDADVEAKTSDIENGIKQQNLLPDRATFELKPFEFGFTERGDDLVVSFYSERNISTRDLISKAQSAVEFIKKKNLTLVEEVSVINPYQVATNPLTGQSQTAQQSFDRYGTRQGDSNSFYRSAIIGFSAKEGADALELDEQVRKVVDELNNDTDFDGFSAAISASNAPDINAQINELQRVLLEGLLAILVVASLVIALRASLLTVITLVTVLAAVCGFLFLIGYTLNTITLFTLILGLALIIDDTIIMVEALDAQRRRQKTAAEAVKQATGKISRAMVAATTTAALSFAPLIFVGGILGSFIRAIPITMMSALFISLFVALIFTPLFARFLLLRKSQIGAKSKPPIAANAEYATAEFLARPMLWAKGSKKRLFGVGITAVLVSFIFIGAAGAIFQKVTFNIFPPSKDANYISMTVSYPPNTSIDEAQAIADQADSKLSKILDENLKQASLYGQATSRNAVLTVSLIDYKDRDIKAPEIIDQLEASFENFDEAQVDFRQIDAGPPASPFSARIDSSENRDGAIKLANDIESFLSNADLKRSDGSLAKIKTTSTSNSDLFTRDNNHLYVEAVANFEDNDTTTLVTLAQQAVEKEFPPEKVASYGLDNDALSFNFGQEDENQESFKTLAIAFPAVLLGIYLLLAYQFKSLFQPLLIFMAIPFSLFGITLGLYLTDNAFSFFAMLGFFALIGLSIKNTILLTDYANQARSAGADAVESAHQALKERFRPLIATSLTAIVSLTPLALTSPFWEGLTVVLIFGLISSTLLVITVFPYYYLAGEYLRARFTRKTIILWAVFSALAITAFNAIGLGILAALSPIAVAVALYTVHRQKKLA